MYLKALEIQGFKSFPDKTVLPFDEEITAVVGPNGSGKSNISDAIRWVVGEQSTRMLRGGKMEDVIFGGTEKRKQTGYAQVSLIMDNATGIFPMEESEVMVTRKYYRSGESEYFINKHQSRLRDVHELFMGTGLGKEGYALIGQGKIDEILSVKSSQRREVFEEAAGIAKYRHQKEEAQRKLARADENMLRIQDKISELELQVKPLEKQSEIAKKFLVLRDELRILEITVWLEQLSGIQTNQIKLRTDYEVASREKNQVSEELDTLYQEMESMSLAMAEKGVEEEQMRTALAEGEATVSEEEAQILLLKNNISNNESNAKRLAESLDQKLARQKELEEQLASQAEKARLLKEHRQSLGKESQEKTAEALSLSGLLQETTELLEQKRRETEEENQKVAQAKFQLSALTSSTQEIFDQDENLRREMAELQGKLSEEEGILQEQEDKIQEAKDKRDGAKNAVEGYRLRVEGRESKLSALKQKQEELARACHVAESKIKLLTDREHSYEDFSYGVKQVMAEARKGRLRNIHGTVSDLISVEGEYTTAIEIALGLAMQNIVVGDFHDGAAVLEYLKKTKGGRVTVLPMSNMQSSYLPQKDQLPQEEGFIGIGDTLVGYDPRYQNIISNLLGRTVIMRDKYCAEATAKKFQRKLRIVTLDGDILNVGGSMTGGSTKNNQGILSHKAELETLKQQLQEQGEALAILEQEGEALAGSLSGDLYQVELAQGELRQWEDSILQLEGQKEVSRRGMEALKMQMGQGQFKLAQLKDRSSKVEHSTQEAQDEIAKQEEAVAQLKVQWDSAVAQQQQLQQRWQEANDLATQLQSQLGSVDVEENALKEATGTISHLLEDVTGELASNSSLIQDFGAENQQYSTEILEMEEKIKESRQKCVDLKEQISRCHQEKQALEQSRHQKDRDGREKNNHLLSMERSVTLLEESKVAGEREEAAIITRLWDTYELTHQAAMTMKIELESLAKANKRIGELKREISSLGHVNINAIEEFEKINERYTYFVEQRDDVLQAKKELEQIIAEIVKEMEEIFAREFGKINDAFGKIFTQLFGGGHGEVILEDPEDVLGTGIEIHAQPPGKALKIISLLSGGEKAFVAIALYFAILQIRPTPFVVMDEIEAALDDSNIERFVQYLRNICDKTQFIIITHRRGTMEAADVLYGITMQEKGVSRMLRLSLNEVEKTLGMEI